MSDKNSIIRKIRACLARADDQRNENEHERAIALRQANALMDAYGVSIVELGDTDELGPRGRTAVKNGANTWRPIVYNYIAKLYGCRVYRTTGHDGSIMIVGREHYRNVVVDMATYVCDSIDRECRRLPCSDRSYRNSWRKGAGSGVGQSVVAILKERNKGVATGAEAVVSGSRSLVLVDHYKTELMANNAWLKENSVHLKTNRSQARDAEGYASGVRHGRGIGLNDQVGGGGIGANKRLS